MKILGIDYGRKKLGFSFAESSLSYPLKVVRINSMDEAVLASVKLTTELGAEKVVVGVSEGEMGEESKEFAKLLEKENQLPIETFDETLTSQDAQRLSQEAGVGRKKRKKMEDAYAATLMLQNYLDTQI